VLRTQVRSRYSSAQETGHGEELYEQFNKILIPTDGSENTKARDRPSLELARAMGAEVTAFVRGRSGVVRQLPHDATVVSIYLSSRRREGGVDYVVNEGAKVGRQGRAQGRGVQPGKKIVDEAENYDLVVMGTLGRTGISKLLLGQRGRKGDQVRSLPSAGSGPSPPRRMRDDYGRTVRPTTLSPPRYPVQERRAQAHGQAQPDRWCPS
jgi:nucleotide-binding universal stress UspA family protein